MQSALSIRQWTPWSKRSIYRRPNARSACYASLRLCRSGSATCATQDGSLVVDRTYQAKGGLPRFFIERLPACKGARVTLKGGEMWHMARTLRLKQGNRIELFDGNGGLARCIIELLEKDGAGVSAEEEPLCISPPPCSWEIVVACGSLKGGRADWLVEKCTELGASAIQPLLTERSPSVGERIDRWERVVLAATKQCQRLHKMTVREPLTVKQILPSVASKWAYLATAGAVPILKSYYAAPPPASGGLLLVGPEGDFTEAELDTLQKAGAHPVGLGPRRLRVETAAMTMLSVLQTAGDVD